MNILAQYCGVVLMIVILFFHSTQKKVHLYSERAFMGIWRVTFASLLLDIMSMALLTYHHAFPDIVVETGCKAYVASLVWVAIFCVNYVCADIYKAQYQVYQKKLFLCGALFTVGVYILPIYMRTESTSKTYTYGPSTYLTYFLALLVLLVLGWLLYRYRDSTSARLRRVMGAWMGVWLLGAVIEFVSIQFWDDALLLVGYASAVGTFIIYLRLENPEANLDWKTGFFNQNAFLLYTGQQLFQKREFYLLCMSCSLGTGENASSGTDEIVFKEMTRFISKISGTKVFRITENEIVFLFFDKEEKERVYQQLRSRFKKPWGKGRMHIVRPKWFSLTDTGIVNRAEDLLELFQYMLQKSIGSGEDNDYSVIDESIIRELNQEKEVEQLLLKAMKQDWIEVFFQPIYSTEKGQFVSAEALTRIHDASGNIIPPNVFIEVAEQTGLIVILGEMVFEKVCRFIQRENPAQYGIEYIEVNLSLIQCGFDHLAEGFINIMKKYDIDPNYINLEITETASLNEKRTLLTNMKALREFGVSFSLDDFGTGHSNLNYIVEMPVDIVKFDRDMIQSYFHSEKAKYVMDAAMHMIQGMQLQIVSEGIETKEQYRVMEKLGISYIQGYYFSKPLPEREFLEFISNG